MAFSLNHDRLVINEEPVRVIFSSEPYVVTTFAGFSVAADVLAVKGRLKLEKTLLLGSRSLSDSLKPRIIENNGNLVGVELSIRKESSERTAKYLLED
jgi:hypothetical protein